MKIRYYLFLVTLLAYGCNAQNSITTNKIFRTKDNLFGVKSQKGNLLIDSIYKHIRIVSDYEKTILPNNENRERINQLEYYLVSNSSNQKAIFDKDGELVFDFVACLNIIIDQHTRTAIVTKEIKANTRPRSYLHHLNGELLLENSYENIAYISNSDLIALIVEDGQNDEFYLFNPFEKNMLGPFDHFNIYNEDMSPFRMKESDFDKYQKLNIIKVRREVDNDYIWGIVDSKGYEILPVEYRNLNVFLEQDKNHPAFRRALKPEGVEFFFKGAHISKPSTLIYFDNNFVKYEFKSSVEKGEYRIEKM